MNQDNTELNKQRGTLLRQMVRIRMVEEEIAKRYKEQDMRCPVHLSIGQEGIAAGICSELNKKDWVFSGHRNHAHYLAKGGNLKKMIAEIYGKKSGCSGGRGGSMHLTDKDAGFIGATPIVGSTIPIATGAALSAKMESKKRVVVVFFGDGAMETGVAMESINFAILKKLPILFACENNSYSVYSPMEVRQPKGREIYKIADALGIRSIKVDGNDVEQVVMKTRTQIEMIRAGNGPAFVEYETYRWREHCGPNYDNDIGYRSEDEYQEWKKRDPIIHYEKQISQKLTEDEKLAIRTEIDESFKLAKEDEFPEREDASKNVYAPTIQKEENNDESEREITFANAIQEAHRQSLKIKGNTYVMGLGVPDPKGIFGTTKGLQEEFGEERVFDIPLAEHAVTGIAIGSAITGLRPVLTHQRLDFALVSIDQIVNQAAKWSYMFNGEMSVPIVIRMIIGRGWGQGPQHSQSLHAWFAHIPGLKVVIPSTPYEAKGMLLGAIEDNNPTIVIEHRWLHGTKGMVPSRYYKTATEGCKVIREGDDVTLVSSGYGVVECIIAAQKLEESGIEAEVIDLRVINPLDETKIIESVEKTKRAIIIDHAHKNCGISSEVLARIAESRVMDEKNVVKRLTLPDHPCPTSYGLSKGFYPTVENIVAEARKAINGEEERHETYIVGEIDGCHHDQPNPNFTGPF